MLVISVGVFHVPRGNDRYRVFIDGGGHRSATADGYPCGGINVLSEFPFIYSFHDWNIPWNDWRSAIFPSKAQVVPDPG